MNAKFECDEGGPKKAKCDGVCITSHILGSVCRHLTVKCQAP